MEGPGPSRLKDQKRRNKESKNSENGKFEEEESEKEGLKDKGWSNS